jgi:hypothetical protein
MKNGDVRGACIALIRHRVGGASLAKPPKPSALGLRLEHGELSAAELASLCAAVLGELVPSGPLANGARRWAPSEALQALLGEYRRVQRVAARSATRPRVRVNGYAAAPADAAP